MDKLMKTAAEQRSQYGSDQCQESNPRTAMIKVMGEGYCASTKIKYS